MLSISNIKSSSHAGHYYPSGDYYMEGKEVVSAEWFGKGAEQLGLKNEVYTNTFKEILSGKIQDRKQSKTIYDQQLGFKNKEGEQVHACGIDMTFSAPKSVSIMSEVAGDKRIVKAHIKAVKNTLSYVENNLMKTRTKKDGIMQYEKVDNMIASLFTHDTSRELDPQLHTHCVVANAIYDKKENKFRSAYVGDIFRTKMFLGQIYRTELAKSVKGLGYTIEKTSDKNTFEIKEVPKELITTFSKRREEIKERLEKYEYQNAKTSANATLMTRKNKQKVQTELLNKEWNKVIKENGTDLKTILENTYSKEGTNVLSLTDINKITREAILHISERNSAFTKATIIQESLKMGLGDISIKDIQKTIAQLEKKSLLFKSEATYLYTTAKAVKLEKETVSLMKQGQNTCKSVLNSDERLSLASNNTEDKLTSMAIEDSLKQGFKIDERFKDKDLIYNTLNSSQKQSADFILSNKDRVCGVQGFAGTGKTYMLNAVRELAQKNNMRLEGMAPTASATKTLGENANISTRTLHSFLFKYEGVAKGRGTEEGLKSIKERYKNTIFIMDESSLASTQQMKNLLTIIDKMESRLVLVGDSKQLNSVEAGKSFYQLQKQGMSTCTMKEIRRQDNKNIKEAVYYGIDGNISKSFEKLKDNIIEVKEAIYKDELNKLNKKQLEDSKQSKFNFKTIEGISKTNTKNIEQKALSSTQKNIYKMDFSKKQNLVVQTAVNKYLSLNQKERENTLILTPANETRREINDLIRQELIKEGKLTDKSDNLLLKHISYKDINKTNKIELETLHNKGLTQTQKSKALFYSKDDVVLFNRTYKSLGVKKGEYYLVNNTDLDKNEVRLEKYLGLENDKNKTQSQNINQTSNNKNIDNKINNNQTNNKTKDDNLINWNPKEVGGRRIGAIELYIKETKQLQKGDVIRHTKNDKHLGLINSRTAEITKIGMFDIHMRDKETNNTYKISKDHHALKHIDYGYASTVHSAQGKTSDNVIAVIESYRRNLTNQKTFYVEVSRAKNDISLIVDDKQKVINQLNIMTGEKSSGLEVKEDCKQVNYNRMNNTLKSIVSSSYQKNKVQSIEFAK